MNLRDHQTLIRWTTMIDRRAAVFTLVMLAAGEGARADAAPTSVDERDPSVALGLSMGVTSAGIVLIAVGQGLHEEGGGLDPQNVLTAIGVGAALAGPTLGHAYAGRVWSTGFATRTIGVGAMAGGGLIALAGDRGLHGNQKEDVTGLGLLVAALGVLTFVGGGLVEIGTASDAARQYNAEHVKLSLAPLRTLDGATGISMVGSF